MRISDWSSDVCSSDLCSSPVFNRNMILGIPIPVLNRYCPPAGGWPPRSSGREWWQQPLSIFHEESLDNLVTERRLALMEAAAGVFSAFRSEERRVGNECVSTCRFR